MIKGRLWLLIAGLYVGCSAAAEGDPLQAGYQAFREGRWDDAYEYWLPEANRGVPQAEYYLSLLFERGLGVERDRVTALTFLTFAAKGGVPKAQYQLGNRYLYGQLIEQDPAQALIWWRRAAEQEVVEAQLRLAAVYYLGRDVERDVDQAFDWYRRAASNGSTQARIILGRFGLAAADDHSSQQSYGPESVRDAVATRVLPAPSASMTNAMSMPSIHAPTGSMVSSYRWSDRPLKASEQGRQDPTLLSSLGLAMVQDSANQETQKQLADLAWIERQPDDAFTLQLFSSDKRQSAERVAANLKSPWRVTLFSFDRFGYQWYGVLAGSFDSIGAAMDAKQQLQRDNRLETPWVRRFGSIRKRASSTSE